MKEELANIAISDLPLQLEELSDEAASVISGGMMKSPLQKNKSILLTPDGEAVTVNVNGSPVTSVLID
ncbi:hypothetical protein [Nostoc sp. 106C]|uniref:hypothetical protein n=1 Tax=Nostoc sp. 106C TaxID=1932667 RepID=UPI000A3D114C|nr:hypothetical protein [Nostoc sp. 106C]OUL20703.1 hypothetical protein BV375_30635 [Nostoc sp. 106C]OUL24585.1 hypothetical protein BV378_19650 [Nostoc sp. RF31YmG]